MKIGDIDGLGEIYDKLGRVLYGKNENFIDEFEGKCKSWGVKSTRGLIVIRDFSCNGKFIVTNKRIVFLGEPKEYQLDNYLFRFPSTDFGAGPGPMVGNIQYIYARSTIAKKEGGKLYMNILSGENKKIKIGLLNL
jgi:hypothetical protein